MMKKIFLILVVAALVGSSFAGVTGKIAGVVTDSRTGEPLPGVNVIINATLMGASTDQDGFYAILNVPP